MFTRVQVLCIALLVASVIGCSCTSTHRPKSEAVVAVRAGMSEDEVLRIAGPPTKKVHSTASNTDSWIWVDSGLLRRQTGTVVFAEGRVVKIVSPQAQSSGSQR